MIFAVNKIDLLDNGHGECVTEVLESCKKQLQELGFGNPVLVPLSSEVALRIRQLKAGMVPYRRARGKPLPPKGQRKGIYESTDLPRIQARLRRQFEIFLAQRSFYRDGLLFSSKVAKVLVKLDRRRPSNALERSGRILIDGKFFKLSDLRNVEKLTGIPVLESLLQNDLDDFSNAQTLQTRKD